MPQEETNSHVMKYLLGGQWAIVPEHLERILAIAQRKSSDLESVKAILADKGRRLENTRNVRMRDGVAIIQMVGPVFRYANLFTAISGATSLEALATDFQTALNSSDVKAIVLEIDSPGGEASGISEFSKLIYEARGKKPVVAYASDYCASAAYWVGSAAERLVCADTAFLGSIGVVATFRKRQNDNSIEIVSTQSPHKRPNVETEEGKELWQTYIDKTANIFIRSVAKYRGVSEDTVLSKFGKGGLLIGEDAVAAGMADEVGMLEGVIATLIASNSNASPKTVSASNIYTSSSLESLAEQVSPDLEKTFSSPLETGDTISETDSVKNNEDLEMTKEELEALLKANSESILSAVESKLSAIQGSNEPAEENLSAPAKEAKVELLKTKISIVEAKGKLTPGQKELLDAMATEVAGNKAAEETLLKLADSFPEHGLLNEAVNTPAEDKLAKSASASANSFDLFADVELDADGSPMIPDSVLLDKVANSLIADAKKNGEELSYRDAVFKAEESEEYKKAIQKINTLRALARS